MRKAVIVLPTYNESENIESLIKEIFNQAKNIKNWEIHVAVIDSQSPDKTGQIVKKLKKTKYPNKLHFLEISKRGLGKAYIKGFSYVLKNINPYVIFEMDADWSHNPKEIKQFLHQIEKGADFVVGSRYIKNGSIPDNWGTNRKIFSIFGNLIIRLGFMKLKITDWTSGFRAIKTWLIKDIALNLDNYTGYVFQVAFLDRALKKGAYIQEVPIQFKDRKKGHSKINSFEYIWQTLLYTILNSSFIKFVVVGITGFTLDFGISYFFMNLLKIKTSLYWLATLISAEIAIINNFTLNNFWSFSYKKIKHSSTSYIKNFTKYNLIASGSLIVQAIGIQLATNIFGSTFWPLYKIVIIVLIVIPYSYLLYNKIVWKEK